METSIIATSVEVAVGGVGVSQRCTEVTIIASKKRHYIGAGTLEPRQRALRAQGWPAQVMGGLDSPWCKGGDAFLCTGVVNP